MIAALFLLLTILLSCSVIGLMMTAAFGPYSQVPWFAAATVVFGAGLWVVAGRSG